MADLSRYTKEELIMINDIFEGRGDRYHSKPRRPHPKERLYRIWGGNRKEKDALLIRAADMDEALFEKARKIDPTVTTAQWTGEEREDKPQ